jgi:hypothetical protein
MASFMPIPGSLEDGVFKGKAEPLIEFSTALDTKNTIVMVEEWQRNNDCGFIEHDLRRFAALNTVSQVSILLSTRKALRSGIRNSAFGAAQQAGKAKNCKLLRQAMYEKEQQGGGMTEELGGQEDLDTPRSNITKVSEEIFCEDPEVNEVLVSLATNSEWVGCVANEARMELLVRMIDTWKIDVKAAIRLTSVSAKELTFIANHYKPGADAAGPRLQSYINKNTNHSAPRPWWTTHEECEETTLQLYQDVQGSRSTIRKERSASRTVRMSGNERLGRTTIRSRSASRTRGRQMLERDTNMSALIQGSSIAQDELWRSRRDEPSKYTKEWTGRVEEIFTRDTTRGQENVGHIQGLPMMFMNQVRLTYRTSDREITDRGAQNRHFGKHLKLCMTTWLRNQFTIKECRRRELLVANGSTIVPQVCRNITSTCTCAHGENCRYLHVVGRPDSG